MAREGLAGGVAVASVSSLDGRGGRGSRRSSGGSSGRSSGRSSGSSSNSLALLAAALARRGGLRERRGRGLDGRHAGGARLPAADADVVVAVGLAVVVDKVLGPLEEAEDLLFGFGREFFFWGGGGVRAGKGWKVGEREREGERGECVERGGEALRKEKEREGNKGDEREGGMN